MDTKQRRIARRKVNEELHRLGLTYHESIPLSAIDVILTQNGFDSPECGIYTGHDGVSSEPVGYDTYLHLTWHRMEATQRWEIVAYVN